MRSKGFNQRRVCWTAAVAGLLVAACPQAQTAAPNNFVIEAEDFNYDAGQYLSEASVMPYYGGAYSGLGAVHNVDYHRTYDEPSADDYRLGESPNVPMTGNPDMNRRSWDVTANWRLGWISDGNWCNYTRDFPSGYYKVFAALSYDGTAPGQLHGTLQRVTKGITTTQQTLQQLGVFDAPGSGGWGRNNLVPLKDAAGGKTVILQLAGVQSLRFSASSGDFDYLDFVLAGPPQISQQPADTTVVENRLATFRVVLANDDPVSFQWQSNRVNIAGGTNASYAFHPKLADSGAKYRCALSNPLGATNSAEATLTVVPDTVKPALVQALNLGQTTVRLAFDEGVSVPGGPASASFALDNGATVSAASMGSTNNEILLTVSPLTFGTIYTVTVNNVADLANTPNLIATNSTISFVACEYAPTDIGGPALAGGVVRLPGGGFEVSGAGADIGGASDQFQFAWEQRSGDFDLQVRVASATITDPFVHAGLMARESLAPSARFAATFTASAQLGCFFEYRQSAGGAAATAAPAGGFPVNYPQTWLRLRRAGAVFTSYASLDGQTWVQLGTCSITGLPTALYVGLAVTSDNAAQVATAQFRDVGPTVSAATGAFTRATEPLGPSSRNTGIIFSEIMYHPPRRADGRELEFVELYNARAVFEDLTGWRISGDIDFRFPDGFKLQAGEFVVIAASPADLKAVYGIANVLGPYTNALPNDAGTIRLRNNLDGVMLEVQYSDNPPWPAAAAGAGHSLVLARPSYGENDLRAWAASELVGGSPGGVDTVYANPQRGVVINEFLAHTDDPQLDYIELYNHSNNSVDLSGCWLSDDPATNKFRLADGTSIAARGFLSFDQSQLGFALNAAGETVYLVNSNATRVLDAVRFRAQENGVASGRCPDGAPTIRRLASPTPGEANAPWRGEDVVINEIMYNPISGESDDEYVELYNQSANVVDLSGWRFTDGIDFEFPPNTLLAASNYLVVAKNAARLLTNYAQLNATNTLGDYNGSLRNSGERLALAKPDVILSTNDVGQIETNLIHIVVAEVTYADGGRWGQWADGDGSSLELIDPHADPLRPSNWADSDETKKGAWTSVSLTGVLDNGNDGFPPQRLHILMQGAGECLVDDVEVFKPGGGNLVSNGGFETGSGAAATGWSYFGNHSTSAAESGTAATGNRCLHVRGQGDGDTGVNSIRTALATGLSAGNTATIRAKVRWLAGWPEVLFRLRGNWLELSGRMAVPKNLGTPGLPNSRAISNAGPAIFDVTHTPALPAANQAVVVTARVSDPDGIGSVTLRYRVDPNTTLSSATMRDDGTSGDAVAGDGVYSATISGRASGTLVAFRIEATDAAGTPATARFPANVPAQECLIRWGDPAPFGTFAHYHLWDTQATENTRGQSTALNNTYRDATLVYGNFRVIYNVGFRDKGSPYHGGAGDFTVTAPADDLLLGTADRVFGSTGNGGSEETGLRGQVANWFAQRMNIPYLHCHYLLLYRNGGLFREVMEDLQQPNRAYVDSWFADAPDGDFYKVAVWFEFQDDNSSFGAVSATIESFKTTGNAYKLARYRWPFIRKPNDGTANNYTTIFDLVRAANDTSTNFVSGLLKLADLEEWMRIFAYHRVMGNWDSWGYGVGQNMYIYKPPGQRAELIPWDIDFVLGLGDGPGGGLWGGQDPVLNRMFDTPAFRRMLWRGFLEAVNGPMLRQNYGPQVEARRLVLAKNAVPGLSDPQSIYDYVEARRSYLLDAINANDVPNFAITSNGGNNFNTATPSVLIEGAAPFVVATVEVNGNPYPVTWTDQNHFQIAVPLPLRTNLLQLVGKDRLGKVVSGATDSITVTYTGVIQRPEDNVVINEIHYYPLEPSAAFVELYNRSTNTPFDLSNHRLDGVGYSFPPGTLLAPGAFLVLAKNRAAFASAYGASIPVFDEFPGSLDHGGEHLTLVRPGPTPASDLVLSDVRYDNRLPWPTNAAGLGPSLQLIDASRDEWRVGNWAATATNDVNRVTPGRANSVRKSLAAFPLLWINEVLPSNLGELTDNAGEADPWIELYNAGATALDLSAFYLTDSYTNLLQWAFPAGAVIQSNQFLVVWADGQPEQTQGANLHTNFRLNPTNGSVALVRMQGSPLAPAVMDYVDYTLLTPGRSFGRYPDGEPRRNRPFDFVTPGAPNNAAPPPLNVKINEFMASNTGTIRDPATGHYEDWFELYNGGTNQIDLTGYTLTDSLTNTTKFVIPPGTLIPPGGFLMVWADETTEANTPGGDLHVNFKLSLQGEELGLFALDGSVVDAFAFEPQTNNISMGRFPDGAEPPFLSMETPTPGEPNVLAGANRPPTISPIGNQTVAEETLLSFTVTATDRDEGQSVTYSLSPDAPAGASVDAQTGLFTWTPSEAQGPGVHSFALRATDNGLPPRSAAERILVTVTEVNRPPQFFPIPDQGVDEDSLLSLQLSANDPDLPPNQLAYSLEAGAPEGLSVDPVTGLLTWRPTEQQGPGEYLITVRVTDDGAPPLSDTTSFRVRVNEVASPPVLANILPQTVDELDTWQVRMVASDPDNPLSPIIYSLDLAPAGAEINATTGLLTWTPTEAQGPTNAIFIVRATKASSPKLTATITFGVAVREVNQPPVLAPVPDFTVQEGDTVAFTATATDADLPPQALAFSLDAGAPPGATIDAAGGRFAWSVGYDHGPSTNAITVRVTDDGPGALSAARTFTVVVQPRWHVVINEIMYCPAVTNAQFIELFNSSTNVTVDLAGVQLAGTDLSFDFPAGTRLSPGAFLLVVKDQTAFAAAYTNAGPVVGQYTGDLNATGDTLRLVRPGAAPGQETVLTEVSYSDHLPWPVAAAGVGASLQLVDARQANERVGNWAAVAGLAPNQPRSLIVITNVWRYSQDGFEPPGWREPGYDDSDWPAGPALLYWENADLPAPKSTPLVLGKTTYYFRTHFYYNGPTLGVTLKLSTVIDDGAVFYLKGRDQYWLGISKGDISYDRFTDPDRVISDAAWEGPFTFRTDDLVRGDNVLAVEVHQCNAGSSDIVFGITLDVEGGALPLYTPGAPNSVRADLPPFPSLWLNEIQPNNQTGVADHLGEREPWIELYNAGVLPVLLDGFYLTDTYTNLTQWAFPTNHVLDPDHYGFVFADGKPAEQTPDEWHTSFRLSRTAGSLALVGLQNGEPTVMDYLDYSGLGPDQAYGSWPNGQPWARQVLPVATPGAANETAPVEIHFTEVRLTPEGLLALSWNSVPGRVYRVEYKDSLSESGWQALADVPATGTVATYSDPAPAVTTQRYYRLRLLQ